MGSPMPLSPPSAVGTSAGPRWDRLSTTAAQVRDELDAVEVMPGIWDPDFIGESQHATATHAVPADMPASEKLARLRADIRRFGGSSGGSVEHSGLGGSAGCDGHVTVIWSASVERPSERCYQTPEELLAAVEASDLALSPSVLYAAAALLEGCSFVNGGSQNTLCPALLRMAEAKGCYVLGTDFKAGQTKFKTAAVEYLRHLGLRPVVVASSNHLGNNDMLNLTARKTLDAKMRVKSDIFGGWEEDIDHQARRQGNDGCLAGEMLLCSVRVMYTRLIGDEKRDVVEYTSLGFMNCAHTMLTYTRAMDSVLCVPLMLDAAVWCDHFARRGASAESVGRALAYLFKIPEGGARGCDPGFFNQMRALERHLEESVAPGNGKDAATAAQPAAEAAATATGAAAPAAAGAPVGSSAGAAAAPAAAASKDVSAAASMAGEGSLLCGAIVCAGLGCLDMQLEGCARSKHLETPSAFAAMSFCPGGSTPQVCTSLARLGVGTFAVIKVGCDPHGDELLRLLRGAGSEPTTCADGSGDGGGGGGGGEGLTDCSCVVRSPAVQTSVAVLPIFQGGGRACFVNLAANESFEPAELLAALGAVAARANAAAAADGGGGRHAGDGNVSVLHFGYPHLLPQMQGAALAAMLKRAREILGWGALLSVDLNGVDGGDGAAADNGGEAVVAIHEAVLGPALPMIDILHANLEEAQAISGLWNSRSNGNGGSRDKFAEAEACADWFIGRGVALVAITLGAGGAMVKVTADAARTGGGGTMASQAMNWAGQGVCVPAFAPAGTVNANGAGDAFAGGLLVALAWRRDQLTLQQAVQFALLSALQRVDGSLRDAEPPRTAQELMADVLAGRLPPSATL
ncbi:unnamed protein product [Phaeothamnion confervicola]